MALANFQGAFLIWAAADFRMSKTSMGQGIGFVVYFRSQMVSYFQGRESILISARTGTRVRETCASCRTLDARR